MTMSYNARRLDFARHPIEVIEVDLDYCQLTQGQGACTATETGDAKCFNTREWCNDLSNYDDNAYPATTKTYRYCTRVSPHPIGIDAVPSIVSIDTLPSKIDITGGLGLRSVINIQFTDHPSSDIDIDKYLDDRTYDPLSRSTYWAKQRARNPNYQFRALRYLTGYLVDGVFNANNFQTSSYVIEKMNVGGGSASITANDPLKLASKGRAQVPIAASALLGAATGDTETEISLTPPGIGDEEFETPGGEDSYCAMGSEVCAYTRASGSDTLTLIRGQQNTTAASHDEGDTVQPCYYRNDKVDLIVADVLINYANMDSSFIPVSAWDAETASHLPGLLEGIITKPTDVNVVLKELSESAPHYLGWDEVSSTVRLSALQAPPPSAGTLGMDSELIGDSVSSADIPNLRASTVIVNFGQRDPTKELTDTSNFRQAYPRVDVDSIAKYNSNQSKVIYSRWINNNNKGAAALLATLYGRRFANIPREIKFSLDAKDSSLKPGDNKSINHRSIVDGTGLPVNTMFQITSSRKSKYYDYTGLEFGYGEEITGDVGSDTNTIYVPTSQNVSLKDIYEGLFGSIAGQDITAIFIIQSGVVIGSLSNALNSLDTGVWSTANSYDVTLRNDSGGYIVGKGGKGGTILGYGDAEDGGDAINMQANLTIVNSGVIGGGGGGGGSDSGPYTGGAGGGGAGNSVGSRGEGVDGNDGTLTTGGDGGTTSLEYPVNTTWIGGKGGDLGEAGEAGDIPGGGAGAAIKKNGFTLTETLLGEYYGTIS